MGSESVISYAKENIYVVKTLKEFQHMDDIGTDVGANGNTYMIYDILYYYYFIFMVHFFPFSYES